MGPRRVGAGTFCALRPVGCGRDPADESAWADLDLDGDPDLAVANDREAGGTHCVHRTELPALRWGTQ